jgi:hypothetical protein
MKRMDLAANVAVIVTSLALLVSWGTPGTRAITFRSHAWLSPSCWSEARFNCLA